MSEITEASLQPLHRMMVNFRRDLHQHPELGFEETRTAGKVAEALCSLRTFDMALPLRGS
jgi:metal-dependent amidase/aminoacylase/carboxypeptidase family protein